MYQSPSSSMHSNVFMHCICHIYTKHMIWCGVFLCSTHPTNKLNPWFLFEKGKESILSIARQISGLQRQYGMNLVGDYEDEFKFGLMEVVFEWARGLVSNYCCCVHSHSYRKACRICLSGSSLGNLILINYWIYLSQSAIQHPGYSDKTYASQCQLNNMYFLHRLPCSYTFFDVKFLRY